MVFHMSCNWSWPSPDSGISNDLALRPRVNDAVAIPEQRHLGQDNLMSGRGNVLLGVLSSLKVG